MKNYLITKGITVVGTAQCSETSLDGLEFRPFQGDANPQYIGGFTFDGEELIQLTPRVITIEEFINRFNQSELKEILDANSVDAKILNLVFFKTTEVNLDDEKIIGSVTYLFNTRKDEILK